MKQGDNLAFILFIIAMQFMYELVEKILKNATFQKFNLP